MDKETLKIFFWLKLKEVWKLTRGLIIILFSILLVMGVVWLLSILIKQISETILAYTAYVLFIMVMVGTLFLGSYGFVSWIKSNWETAKKIRKRQKNDGK